MLKRYHRPKYAVTFIKDGAALASFSTAEVGDGAASLSPLAAGVENSSVRAARPPVGVVGSCCCIRTLLSASADARLMIPAELGLAHAEGEAILGHAGTKAPTLAKQHSVPIISNAFAIVVVAVPESTSENTQATSSCRAFIMHLAGGVRNNCSVAQRKSAHPRQRPK